MELYDLEEDPGERNDVAAQHAELTAALQAQLAGFRSRSEHDSGEALEMEIDRETYDRLHNTAPSFKRGQFRFDESVVAAFSFSEDDL